MFASLVYLALVQVACALSIPQDDLSARTTHHHQKRLVTGAKVALGLCIPGAVLVVGLGVFIMVLYPAQLRKLRRQNPGTEVGLSDLMNGKYPPKPAPPPPYAGHEGSSTNNSTEDATHPPEYPVHQQSVQPKTNTPSAPLTDAEARHAALMS
jgi:hypothetical protein